jgi:hypothetical protein
MKEEMMNQPGMAMEIEIQGAEQEDENMFGDMAPRGRFTAKALNNLVKATNRLLPLFDQTPDYPSFNEDITEFPTDFVRVLAMFEGAVNGAIEEGVLDEEMDFDMSEVTGDENINMLAGKLNRLVNDRSFKKYLKDMPQGEGEDTKIDEPDMASNDKMEDEDVDALFMERM